MNFWQKTSDIITEKDKAILLLVVASEGSSPGRQGFKMLVTAQEIFGSIGGGIMEYQLVETARELLNDTFVPFVKKQIHKGKIQDGSGMICSGEQTVLFYPLAKKQLETIHCLATNKGFLDISPTHFDCTKTSTIKQEYEWKQEATTWHYTERLNSQSKLYIIGSGHIGFALSKIAQYLDFEVHLLDNRKALNTFENNTFVHQKTIIDYSSIAQYVDFGTTTYIVIMTNSYLEDKLVLEQVLSKKHNYLGVLGSKSKLKTLFEVLESEGYSKDLLTKVRAPIGMAIHSKTPEEIAISILAEIIAIKNIS